MQVYCQGSAIIRLGGPSGEEFVFTPDDLDWDEAGMMILDGVTRIEHIAYLNHPDLGFLSWTAWESPAGVQAELETDVGENFLLRNFEFGLEHSDEEVAERQALVDEAVSWFLGRYEDPAMRTGYNSGEGGYLWDHGGPFDAREEIQDAFDLPDDLLAAAVREVEAGGTHEWAAGDWWDRERSSDDYDDLESGIHSVDEPLPDISEFDFEPGEPDQEFDEGQPEEEFADGEQDPSLDIPEQSGGISFVVQEDGRIGISRLDSFEADEREGIEDLRTYLVQVSNELLALLHGSNAFGSLTGIVRQYHSVIVREAFPIGLIYALGVRLENLRARLQVQIDSGDYPSMGMDVGAALDTLLAIHGPMILKTARGRELVALALEFSRNEMDVRAYREAARPLAGALSDATEVVAPEAADIVAGINEDIAAGPHLARSLQVAHNGNRNMLIAIATLCAPLLGGVVASGVEASVPGAGLAAAVTKSANAAWEFLSTNAPLLRNFVAASGMADMGWLRPLLNRVMEIGPRR